MEPRTRSGIPTFSGDVIKGKLELGVAPAFDESFPVKVRKVQPFPVPELKNDEVHKVKIKPEESAFNDKIEVRIHKIRGGN
jgi:hypothetical protein